MKRTPLARGTKALTRTELRRTSWLPAPRRPLPRRSARTIAEAPLRAAVALAVHRRDKVCQAAARGLLTHVACGGRLEVNEVIMRSGWRAGSLVAANTDLLCSRHHAYVTTHPIEAVALGLRRWSHEPRPHDETGGAA